MSAEIQHKEGVESSQEDILLVMQKLMSERKKAKILEEEVNILRKNNKVSIQDLVAPPISERYIEQNQEQKHEQELKLKQEQEQEQEIVNLKKIVKDLAEKLKKSLEKEHQVPKIVEDKEKIERIQKFQQELFSAQSEVRAVKQKNAALEDEVKRFQQYQLTLQNELKQQGTRYVDLEKIKGDLLTSSQKFQECEKALISMTKLKDDIEIEYRKSENALQKGDSEFLDLKEQLKTYIAIQNNYEVLKQEFSNKENDFKSLQENLREEKMNCIHLKEEKKQILHSLEEKDEINLRQREEITNLRIDLSEKENISIKYKKELQEKSQKLHELENQEIEHKRHIELLEQHLARRVKECAQLTKAQEESLVVLSELQSKLHNEKAKLQELEINFSLVKQKEQEVSERLREQFDIYRLHETKWHQDFQLFQERIHSQEIELNDLKKVEGKYLIVQQLITQCNQIFSARKLPFEMTQASAFLSFQPERDSDLSLTYKREVIKEEEKKKDFEQIASSCESKKIKELNLEVILGDIFQ